MADKALGATLSAPSVSYGAQNLYMRGPLEEATRGNLARVRQPVPFFGVTAACRQRAICSRRLCHVVHLVTHDTHHAPLITWEAQLQCTAMHVQQIRLRPQNMMLTEYAIACVGRCACYGQGAMLDAALQAIGELVDGDGAIVQVNDRGLTAALRVKLCFADGMER